MGWVGVGLFFICFVCFTSEHDDVTMTICFGWVKE